MIKTMKKLLMILMLSAFSYAASATYLPQQDTVKSRQDTTRKHTSKKYPTKKKTMKKKNWPKKDTLNKNKNQKTDTTARPIQVEHRK